MTTPTKEKTMPIFIALVILTSINIILSVISFFSGSVSPTDIRSAVEAIEIERIGGVENYGLFKKMVQNPTYQEQNKEQLQMMLDELTTPPTNSEGPIFSGENQ